MDLKTWINKNNVPDLAFFEAKTIQYKKNRYWYNNSNKIIKELFNNDFDLFVNILGATSPRTTVKSNVYKSCETLYDIKRNSDIVISYGIANKLITNNVNKIKKGLKPSGIKINQFIDSLKLIDGAVCIDVWMCKAFNLKRNTPTNNDRKHITFICRSIGKKLHMPSYQVQACLWAYAKNELNKTIHKSYKDFSYYIHQANNKYKLVQTTLNDIGIKPSKKKDNRL